MNEPVVCYKPVSTWHLLDGTYITLFSNGETVTGNYTDGVHPPFKLLYRSTVRQGVTWRQQIT